MVVVEEVKSEPLYRSVYGTLLVHNIKQLCSFIEPIIFQAGKKFFSFRQFWFRTRKFLQKFYEANWQNNKIIVSADHALF